MKKINIIDILIILAIVFVLVIGYVYMSGKNIIKNTDEVIFNLTVEDISLETAAQFNEGENIYNSVNGKPLGIIKSINVYQYRENFFDKNTGEYRQVDKLEHYSVDLKIQTEAEIKDNNYYAADLKIAIGTRAYLRGKNYVCQGKILGVSEVIDNEK